jgi:hypothetical protein
MSSILRYRILLQRREVFSNKGAEHGDEVHYERRQVVKSKVKKRRKDTGSVGGLSKNPSTFYTILGSQIGNEEKL